MTADQRAAASRLREVFLDVGFTADGVLAMLGSSAYAALGRDEMVPARQVLADRTGVDVDLVRLFVLGDAVERSRLNPLLPVADMEFLELVGGTPSIAALVDVRPYGESDTEWYVVSDHGPGTAGRSVVEVAADHVLGVGGASLTLARITPRDGVDSALDLGTGCGVQALHLGRHAKAVVATDRNGRALRLAGVTAALSGQRWDLREGSLFEPVAGAQFDLVVSNPPFVISPGHRYTYRDAGLPADDLGRVLVQQAPTYLRDGGTAVILANWLHRADEDWRERVAAWLESTGCDSWVAQREVQDPAEYVGLWLRDAGHAGVDHDRRYDEWLRALDDMGAEGIGFGWIVLHRGGSYGELGPRLEDVSAADRQPRGDEVTALMAARARWHEFGVVALLDSCPRRPEGLRLVTEERADPKGYLLGVPGSLGVIGGWRQDELVDVVTSALIRAFDGHTSVSAAVDVVSAELELDVDDVLAGAILRVRELVEDGALILEVDPKLPDPR